MMIMIVIIIFIVIIVIIIINMSSFSSSSFIASAFFFTSFCQVTKPLPFPVPSFGIDTSPTKSQPLMMDHWFSSPNLGGQDTRFKGPQPAKSDFNCCSVVQSGSPRTTCQTHCYETPSLKNRWKIPVLPLFDNRNFRKESFNRTSLHMPQ